MSNLVENLKSIIEKEFITLYDFVLNFSKYNNDSLENTGIFLCNIGFDRFNTIFGNEKYNIYLYGMESDYRMYSTQYLIDRYDPLPKIMNQIKQGYMDRELTSQIFLRKSELLNTFNLREMMSFLTEDMPKNSTTTEDSEVITLKNQLTQAHSEIDRLKAELEQAHIEIENFKNMKTKNYITPELQIIDDVIAEFWENHTDDKIPVKKDVIVDWIIEKYNISNNIASAIDSITRPEYARTGGLKALSKRPKD